MCLSRDLFKLDSWTIYLGFLAEVIGSWLVKQQLFIIINYKFWEGIITKLVNVTDTIQ